MTSRIVPVLSALAQQRQLRAQERLSRDELLARQAAALARLASYVSRHSPFYRAHWGGELGERVTLEQLAPVKRSALMTSFDAMIAPARTSHPPMPSRSSTRSAGVPPLAIGRYNQPPAMAQ
jgi:hypothetical protein